MMYFAPTDIGPTRKLTWDGFLLCLDVPIARIGRMVYGPNDLPGYKPGSDGKLQVDRTEDDLFAPETIASFNGKAVTNDHPSAEPLLSPRSWRTAAVGVALNPRRGEGDMEDCLVCDLLVQDAQAIDAVQNGKVQVSAGYDASYNQTEPGRLQQGNIKGNHVALVKSGRCGPRCAIGDEAPHESNCSCDPATACQCGTSTGDSVMAERARIIAGIKTGIDKLATLDAEPDAAPAPAEVTHEGAGDQHIHIHLPGKEDMSTPAPMGDAKTKDSKTKDAKTKDARGALRHMRDKRRTKDAKTSDAIPGSTPTEQPDDADDGTTDVNDLIMEVLDGIMGRLETIETAIAPKQAPAVVATPDKRTKDDAGNMEHGELPEAADKGIGSAMEMADASMTEEEAEKAAAEKDRETKDSTVIPDQAKPPTTSMTDLRSTRDAAGKVKDRDSTHLQSLVTETISRGHILAQNVSMPTTDAKDTATMTLGRLCGYRRNVLRAAFNDTKTQPIIKPVVPNLPTLDACNCDTITAMFNGASELVAKVNNKTIGVVHNARMTHGGGVRARTPAEINEQNRKRWGTS